MSVNWRNAASGRRTLIPHNFFNELRTQDTSRLRKKAFRSLLSLSVISPRGGELKEVSQLYRRVRKDSS